MCGISAIEGRGFVDKPSSERVLGITIPIRIRCPMGCVGLVMRRFLRMPDVAHGAVGR